MRTLMSFAEILSFCLYLYLPNACYYFLGVSFSSYFIVSSIEVTFRTVIAFFTVALKIKQMQMYRDEEVSF